MGGFFLRPKNANIDSNSTSTANKLNAEAIGVVSSYEDEYIPVTGFDETTDGLSGAIHRKDPKRREASPNAPLPTGSWRNAVGRRGSLKGR